VRSSSPPLRPITLTAGGDGVDPATARAVLDLALRTGEALLSTGAPALDVTASVLRLVDAYGLTSCHVDVTYTSITVSYHRGEVDVPMTVMRIVRVRAADYSRLEDLQTLIRDAVAGGLAVQDARERLEEIVRAPHPYQRWLVTVALATLGAAVAALLGGGALLMALTAATTAAIDQVQRALERFGLPAFFTQAVGGAIPTVVAVVLVSVVPRTALQSAQVSPSLVVAAGIVVLLAGLSVVGAAQDALDGFYVTAGARGLEVLVLTLGIIAGIVAVLSVAQHLGAPMRVVASQTLSSDPAVQVAAAVAVSALFAVSGYTRGRGVAVAAGAGGLGWVTFLTATTAGLGAAASAACAAAVVGLLAQVVSTQWRVPSLVITTAAIVPLLPGLAVYRGLFQLVEQGPTQALTPGLSTLLGAAATGIGLAAGISLGTFTGRRLRSELDVWQRRLLRRGTGVLRD
jgi:uncharacterized membrane protein YjjP (DUF1212 family)